MGLNPNAPAWTPGLCSSGERSGDSPDRNGRAAHCVGMHHKREEGVESDGVGWLNLPVNQDKHRADKFSQRVRTFWGLFFYFPIIACVLTFLGPFISF